MATVVHRKSYCVVLTVCPSKDRRERGEGGLRELMAFILGAPDGSPLRRCVVDPEHREDFPRLRVERVSVGTYRFQFNVEAGSDTDAMVEELWAVFNKNGWRRW